MNEKEIKIKIDLNSGDYSGIAWGCDLTEEYEIFNEKVTLGVIDPYNMDLSSLELGRFVNDIDV